MEDSSTGGSGDGGGTINFGGRGVEAEISVLQRLQCNKEGAVVDL